MQKILLQHCRSGFESESPKGSLTRRKPQIPGMIALQICTHGGGEGEEIVQFRVAPKHSSQARQSSPESGDHLAPVVSIGIDFSLFALFSRSASLHRQKDDPIQICDSLVAELALGLCDLCVGGDCFSHAVSATACVLCERLASALEESDAQPRSAFCQWQTAEIAQALSENLAKDVSVEMIAGRCRLSVCHFARLFKVNYGMPFHRFRINERIRAAQNRLATSDDTISDIALNCGFSDQACLTRRFTSVTGVSPAVWRKRKRSVQSIPPLSLDTGASLC